MIEVNKLAQEGVLVKEKQDIQHLGNNENIEIMHKEINFPQGIIGFEDIITYSVSVVEDSALYKLTGAGDGVIFYVINPYAVKPDYSLAINTEEYTILQNPNVNEILVFSILTLQENIEDTTCNLLGPILINNNNGIALQVVNNSDSWGTKHLLSTGEKIH